MNQTISYYEEHAAEFCKSTLDADMTFCRNQFLRYLNPQSRILDAGCGSGRDSKAFAGLGYSVTAMDASPKICAEAEKVLGQKVLCQSFEELDMEKMFDGIWACASLLHVPKEKMPKVLYRLKQMQEIVEMLSAAKTPKKDRKGNPYADVIRAHMPLLEAMQTASRKAFKRAFC